MSSINILSIDGGGVRGIIVTQILSRIEKEFGISIYNYFDVFAGSSVGSMIVGALAYKQATGAQLVENYMNSENIRTIMPKTYKKMVITLVISCILIIFPLSFLIKDPSLVTILGLVLGIVFSLICGGIIYLGSPRFTGTPKTQVIESFVGKGVPMSQSVKDVFTPLEIKNAD